MSWFRFTSKRERELERELRFHLEQRMADNLASGMSSDEARRRALLEFRGMERVKEECRELHWESVGEGIWLDLRFAIRNLRKDPRFSLLAVMALGLGIGAATVVFSALYGVLLNTFPFKDADQVTSFAIVDQSHSGSYREFLTLPEFLYFREHNHVFQDFSGEYGGFGSTPVRYTTGGSTYQIDADYLTVNSFDFFGVEPLLGRLPNESDVKPGATPVFVIGEKLWRQQFEADPSVIGRSFTLNGTPTVLVGIMPRRFRWAWVDAWLPFTIDENQVAANPTLQRRSLYTVGRLKPGITMKEAAADLDVVAHQYAKVESRLYPKQFTVNARTLAARVVGGFKSLLYPLIGAVLLLLLISCVNVANLLLARATVREREISVRAALGASRGRLLRQFLIESICLAVAGCTSGLVLAYVGIKALVPFVPYNAFPQEAVIELNTKVLLFSVGTALITTLICGIAPAVHGLRSDVRSGLGGNGPGSATAAPHGRLRSALVIVEVALSVVLLVCAGLLMHTFLGMRSTDLGFNPKNVLFARVTFPPETNRTAQSRRVELTQLIERLKALPGVTSATPTLVAPPNSAAATDVDIPGKVHSERWRAVADFCGEDYADVLQLRIVQGRFLSENDVTGAQHVVVINEAFARQYFGNQSPIGQSVKFGAFDRTPELKDALFEIVGVTANVKNQLFAKPPVPQVYMPYSILPNAGTAFAVRTALRPESLVKSVRELVWSVDPNAALMDATSLESWLNKYVYAEPQFEFLTLATFAAIGLTLVMIGVFSVMAYTVALQTREIGIRMALGAARNKIVTMVLGRGAVLLLVGIAIGLAGSAAATQLIAHQLVGVSPLDPDAGALALVIVTGVVACLAPALRAAKVDPLEAIRYE
jgi:predicted permease